MVTKKKYQMIEIYLQSIGEEILDDSFTNIIQTLTNLQTQYQDYQLLRICYDRWDHCGMLYGSRPETDKERDMRLSKAAKQRAKRAEETARVNENKEVADRKEYERLKKKFDNA